MEVLDMNLLKDKSKLRNLIKHGDLMNTVHGGVRATHFSMEQDGDDLVVKVSNPSIDPKSFNFTIYNNQIIINALHIDQSEADNPIAFPVFTKVIDIPFYVDITRIEGVYEEGAFKIYLPYNRDLQRQPYPIKLRYLDDE